MNLRQALIEQSPSLALQRAAADEIARLDKEVAYLWDRLQKQEHETAELAAEVIKEVSHGGTA